MKRKFGIRREDKNKWEKRVPIVPEHVQELKDRYGVHTIIQPSILRNYLDEEFKKAGATVSEDLSQVDTIFSIKEIPLDFIASGKTYIFFSHTIKGQPYNMKLLQRLMEMKCNLIDYERIVNERNQRLIFFGVDAGYAGIIETLYAFAQKMDKQGYSSPLSNLNQAYEYNSLYEAKASVIKIGNEIAKYGFPKEICPLVIGFAGYGNVSRGAQEILDLLPVKAMTPRQLLAGDPDLREENHCVIKVIFKEKDLVEPLSGEFELQNYYDHPEKYKSTFKHYLPFLSVLLNCVYWTEKYPRLVSKTDLKRITNSKLEVVGDISCDIEGAIEITKKATMPDNACFTYFPDTDKFKDGILENGITVMAIDNLPCEFSREASNSFSSVLKEYVNDIVSMDFSRDFDNLKLPIPIKKALILQNGHLTRDYNYMNQFIEKTA